MNENIQALDEGTLTQVSGGGYNGPVFVLMVKPGETLGQIAAQYNTTVAILAEINKLTNPDLLTVGQKILVPSNW